jgi:phosphoadenosine phosphosulfate reductase
MKSEEIKKELTGLSVDDQLRKMASLFARKIIFTTSLGIEDQVITHKIFSNNLDIQVVTLDTGRLFPQTYDVLSSTVIKYNKQITVFFPNHTGVEKMVTEKGPLSFYRSVENRKECCGVRKIEPLNRALTGMECWISGIRADQSDNRHSLDILEYDNTRNIYKFYPIFDWSYDDVKSYVKQNNIPYNLLHDKGYVSIGCEPCTRAVKPGEDFRAGRWWWENDGPKECGLHSK